MKTKRFKGDTVIYFIFAVLCVALGVVLIPSITDLGQQILNVLIAVYQGYFAIASNERLHCARPYMIF